MLAPKEILVIRLDRLGDLVLSLPAFVSLRKNFPKVRITALVNKPFGEMLLAHGFADEAIEFDAGKNRGITKKTSFLFCLSKKRFDFAVDLQHARNDFSALALLFANARTKVGYAIGLRRLTAKNPVRLIREIVFEKTYPLKLLERIGLKTVESASFKKNNAAEKKINAFLKKHKAEKHKIVCIHAGVSEEHPNKAWPKERFAELAVLLAKGLGAKVFLTGTKKEDALLDFIAEKSNSAAIKANVFSLNETIELIKKMDLFITNNTGPMHIAIMLNKPTIILNAFSNPKRWVEEKKLVIMLVSKTPCWPCETGKPIKCNNEFKCIRGISVANVFENAKNMLKQN